MIKIPEECKFIFEKLENNGFECFAVGGCVRDSLMNIKPKDWDFTTNATPDEICDVFSGYKIVETGKRFGTISVFADGICYEITTFRTESGYSDSRHPDSVIFSSSIEDDLSRRDFTMNSIAYSEKRGIIDPFNGCSDIINRVIRCTGDPEERFTEDALRIIRALRFSSVLGFSIDPNTSQAIISYKDRLSLVHPQRMRKELSGLLIGEHVYSVLREYKDVIGVIIPEFVPSFDCVQNNPHHKYSVWEHTLYALHNSPADEIIRLSLFFHDIGKPYMKSTDKNGVDHFHKHPQKSSEFTETIMKRFGYPADIVRDVSLLVRYHDERFRNYDQDIKRVLGAVGKRLLYMLFMVSECDISAQSDYKKTEKKDHLSNIMKVADRILSEGECYSLKAMDISGDDIILLGYKGAQVGEMLNELLKRVINGKVKNKKTDLINEIKKIKLSDRPD